MVVAIALCATACNKNKSDVEDKSQDPNPYPYLRISDVEIYYEKTISEAEDILYKNGYKGGFISDNEGYKYVKGNDTICLGVSDENIVSIIYTSAIKVNPVEAKGWLLHPTATYQGKYPLKFNFCRKYPNYSIIEDFKTYENNINILSSKDEIEAFWMWYNNDTTKGVWAVLIYNQNYDTGINAGIYYHDAPMARSDSEVTPEPTPIDEL